MALIGGENVALIRGRDVCGFTYIYGFNRGAGIHVALTGGMWLYIYVGLIGGLHVCGFHRGHACGFNRGQGCMWLYINVALMGARHVCGFNRSQAYMWL